ncbi:MAG TPA: cyclase family protein [Burkholderiales bacterium]|nr:cyclase family protein [Burkholderiales bacterium]
MKIVDLSMTVMNWDKNSFAPEETYFKLRPIVKWEDKGFVSNMVEMTVHAGTHVDSPHHFYRDLPCIEQIPVETFVGEAVVVDLTFKGVANARITPEDLERAEKALNAQGIELKPGGIMLLRTDWPRSHSPLDPSWWDESPCLTKAAAEWIVAKQPRGVGFDFAQEEKGGEHEYEQADQILTGSMRVHRAMLSKIQFQIENLINLHELPSKVQIAALPAKWHSESAPARVIGIIQ